MVTFNPCYIKKKKQVLIFWKRNVFSRFTSLEKREMLNVWFILVVTLAKRACASTGLVLGVGPVPIHKCSRALSQGGI